MLSSRRDFLKQLGGLSAGMGLYTGLPGIPSLAASGKKMFFEISLAEWSLHQSLFAGKMTNLDFPVKARQEFGISEVEYVNQFFINTPFLETLAQVIGEPRLELNLLSNFYREDHNLIKLPANKISNVFLPNGKF